MRRARKKRVAEPDRGSVVLQEMARSCGDCWYRTLCYRCGRASYGKNGNVIKMESGLKSASSELTERLRGTITRLQAQEGQSAETLRKIEQLNERRE